jgi:hypothetical protein
MFESNWKYVTTMVKTQVLKLPDFDKAFEINSDAFDFVIGRFLV